MIAGVGAIISERHRRRLLPDVKSRRRAIVTALVGGIHSYPAWSLAPNQAVLIAGAFSDAVHGAGGVGRGAGASLRTLARQRAWLSSRLRLPVRRVVLEYARGISGSYCRAHLLVRDDDGDYRGRGLRGSQSGCVAGRERTVRFLADCEFLFPFAPQPSVTTQPSRAFSSACRKRRSGRWAIILSFPF